MVHAKRIALVGIFLAFSATASALALRWIPNESDTLYVDGALKLRSDTLSFRRLAPLADRDDAATLRLTYQLTDNPHHVLWFDIVLPKGQLNETRVVEPRELWVTVQMPDPLSTTAFSASRRLKFRGVDARLELKCADDRLSGSLQMALKDIDDSAPSSRPTTVRAHFSQVSITSV